MTKTKPKVSEFSADDVLNLEEIPRSASLLSIATQRAARKLKSDLHKLLMAHGDLGLADFRLLRHLSKADVATQKELALGAAMEQVSRSLASLEKRQMVQSCVYPNDRRVRLFSLLPKGRAAFESVRPKVAEHNANLSSHLTEEEEKQTLRVLGEIVRRSAQSINTNT
ncbi:MarR family winged helix-turn-helix transcriptional regulator [uncultured Ruegeria sp.]|uniref:MarR family winged helix-turn-helix transcriptional regulator n=1 Tax=uncultured Ruegeria sp. TaxID=259304 RepID=UPI00260FF255|nr:MarR family winged helix-turn-helix transcriptional regulator [uncultured Ruegeria sp.]